MEELSYEELEFMALNQDIIMEKVDFLSDYKNIIVDNLSAVSYELYKVLVSNKKLDELKEYKKILKTLDNKEVTNSVDEKDEKYILETLLGFSDRVSTNIMEREKARKRLSRYNPYFEKNKTKIRVRSV